MNSRRIAAAAIIAWLISIPLGAVVHHGILGAVYAADAAAFRADSETVRRLPVGYVTELFGFVVAASMFASRRPEQRSVVDGLRFGFSLGLLIITFGIVWNYVTQPISIRTGVAELFESAVVATICGAVIGAVCRDRSGPLEHEHRVSA
jgi:hypothetical protein